MIGHHTIGPGIAEVGFRSLVERVDLVMVAEQRQLGHAGIMPAGREEAVTSPG